MSDKTDLGHACIDSFTKLNSNISRKRWHLAFAAIYYSRAFSGLAGSSKPQNYIEINQSSLAQLVKYKDLGYLHKLGGLEALVSALQTDVDHGIHEEHADGTGISRRQEIYGMNTYLRRPVKSFFRFLMEPLKDVFVLIDIFGVVLSLVLGIIELGFKQGWYQGVSIFVAVAFVITVSAICNYRQSRRMDKFSQIISTNIQVKVVRNKRHEKISISDVVVGDIVFLNIGDQVPADGLFVEGHSLQIDESSMTQLESKYLAEINHDKNPFILSGTKVTDGYARFLVTSVGMNTKWGEMMSSTSQDFSCEMPLQARLNKLTSSIHKINLVVSFLVNVVLLLRIFMGHVKDEDVINDIRDTIISAISILFITIPEGLPLAITLVLDYSMKRMIDDQAMVRNISACETMGCTNTICTNKAGTLMMNKMKVTKFYLGQTFIDASHLITNDSNNVLEIFHQGAALNTTGVVYKTKLGCELEISGSPTEKAILSWAVLDLKVDMKELQSGSTLLHVEAFNSMKKRSGILVKKNGDNTKHVHWKGAPEVIIAMCSDYYDPLGNVNTLDDFEREKFEKLVQSMGASCLSCIAFAHKQVSEHECGDNDEKLIDENLILLGLVGIRNQCHPKVWKAVQDCQEAGLKVMMITGDNVCTAKAVATECGILKFNQAKDMNRDVVVEGLEFWKYTQEERMEKVDKICVMARSSPLDKLLMVQCLKQKGHIVALTGDGTNDAPALLEANVGLSMGISGTEVVKESSDIVILDDNLATVVNILRWGRCVHENIQKFIQFQLTVNVVALLINFVASVLTTEAPLTTVNLAWINVIMNTLGALALASEVPSRELMEKQLVGHKEPLVSNIMWRNLIAQAVYQILVLLTLQFGGKCIFDVEKKVKDTMLFNTFVLSQVFNAFNARKLESKNVFLDMHKNKLFLWIIGITFILQALMIEFLVKSADTERLSWGQWEACIGISVGSLLIGFLAKLVPVPDKPFFQGIHE